MTAEPRRITVPQFTALKGSGRKIAMLTAYDFPTAQLVDAAGVEGVLVGDSLAMVVQGRETTLPVTLDEMIYHAEMVGRAVRQALVVVDLPFPTFHLGPRKAIAAGARILKQTRAQAVKLEGSVHQAEIIRSLVEAGIPVMAHCGLRPQSIHQLGQFRVQRDESQLLADARASQVAGAFAVVLECVPAEVAERVTAELQIPTIGIGAGPGCDGQILVLHDLLGLTTGRLPHHVKPQADLKTTIVEAVARYRDEVRAGTFPGPEQSFR
jgi:3-methyl-2-oxobutanoate hydroxymethyltransferase